MMVAVAFVIVGIITPSGKMFGLELKYSLLFLLILFYFRVLCHLAFILGTISLLLFSWRGAIFGAQPSDIASHFVALLLPLIGLFIFSQVLNTSEKLRIMSTAIFSAMIIYGLLKGVLYFFWWQDALGFFEVVRLYEKIFSNKVVHLSTEFMRLSVQNENIFGLFPLVSLLNREKPAWLMVLFVLLCSFVVISANSRFIYGLLCLNVIFLTHYARKFLIIAISTSIIVAFDTLHNRFTGLSADQSDAVRVEIYKQIFNVFKNNPFFGIGIGNPIPGFVRFDNLPWNYEPQTLTLFMHMGTLGAALYLFIFCLGFIKLFPNVSSAMMPSLIVFTIGLFNSFLLSHSTFIIILIFAIWCWRKIENNAS